MPWYMTGAVSLADIPTQDDEEEGETVVLKDDDDIEAWWSISDAKPLEVQVVLDSASDAAGEMAQILGVQGALGQGGLGQGLQGGMTGGLQGEITLGMKRPRVDSGVWEEVVQEDGNGGRRRRVG